MKIKNYCKHITTNEIQQVVNLLTAPHRNLDIKIILFKNKLHAYLHSLLTRFAIEKLHGAGDFSFTHNEIRIYPNYKKIKNIKLNLINMILHEIRHKYQSVYIQNKFERDALSYVSFDDNTEDNSAYYDQWIEIDARRFATTTMNNNKDKISKILGEESNWSIDKDY